MPRLLLYGVVPFLVLGLSTPLRASEAEDKAVAFVKKLGGSVSREKYLPGNPVANIDLTGTRITDSGLKQLSVFKDLLGPRLRKTRVTDASLKELAGFKNL